MLLCESDLFTLYDIIGLKTSSEIRDAVVM